MTRRSTDEWRTLFNEHATSGMTITAFCAQRELNPAYFGVRRKQLLGKETVTATPSFVPVVLTGRDASTRVELHLGEGLHLHFPTSVSPCWLAELLHQLRG
jgi:hypothetical protein